MLKKIACLILLGKAMCPTTESIINLTRIINLKYKEEALSLYKAEFPNTIIKDSDDECAACPPLFKAPYLLHRKPIPETITKDSDDECAACPPISTEQVIKTDEEICQHYAIKILTCFEEYMNNLNINQIINEGILLSYYKLYKHRSRVPISIYIIKYGQNIYSIHLDRLYPTIHSFLISKPPIDPTEETLRSALKLLTKATDLSTNPLATLFISQAIDQTNLNDKIINSLIQVAKKIISDTISIELKALGKECYGDLYTTLTLEQLQTLRTRRKQIGFLPEKVNLREFSF